MGGEQDHHRKPDDPWADDGGPADDSERTRRADLWQNVADERELLADEREAVADERDWLADERDRQIDHRILALQRLEFELAEQGIDARERLAAVREAVRRAEPEPGRAAEELARARQAAARAEGRLLREAAAEDRADAAETLRNTSDGEEREWLMDRRDFVAAERDRIADERERSAQHRDDSADMREIMADKRERVVSAREKELGDQDGLARLGKVILTPGADRSAADSRRRDDRDRRVEAARRREADANDRQSATRRLRPDAYGKRLLASFSELASTLFTADEPALALAPVLDYAVTVLPGCDAAGLTLWRHGAVFDSLATNTAAATLDNVQFVSGEGPAWQAMQDGAPVHVCDVHRATRWPGLAAAAASLGVKEMMCYGLVVTGERARPALGCFTLFSDSTPSFSDDEFELAAILASYLAVAVAGSQRAAETQRRESSLQRALSTRDVIGQAKGILMERQGLSAPEAFDVLRRASQRLNVRLGDVAEKLVQTGHLSDDQRDVRPATSAQRTPPPPLI